MFNDRTDAGIQLASRLKEYKDKGTLTDYKVKTGRMGKYHYFLEMDLFLDTEKGGEKDIWNQKRTRENHNRSRNKWTTNGNAEDEHGKHASHGATGDGTT